MYLNPGHIDGPVLGDSHGLPSLPLGGVAVQAAGVEAWIAIEGTKQGKFKGEDAKQPGQIRAIKFRYEVVSPRDTASGMASGKRRHSPVLITKRLGAASPQLFEALVTNEPLKSVVVGFYAPGVKGISELQQSIKLINAAVVQFRQFIGDDSRALEEVAFTFQQIQIENKPAATAASDSWMNS